MKESLEEQIMKANPSFEAVTDCFTITRLKDRFRYLSTLKIYSNHTAEEGRKSEIVEIEKEIRRILIKYKILTHTEF